jgi:minor histocompatibility antigen H13
MMVTVAKSLDVPIKLVIPRPDNPNKPGIPQYSMLGLGDIVLPGMMIGLALRYDLHRHYLKQQQPKGDTASLADEKTPSSAIAVVKAKYIAVVKAKYIAPGNFWSSKFWTSSWFGTQSRLPASVQTGSFKKTYFWTSVVGYIVGMIATLVVMQWFQHAQPALLYLVPGVIIPLWGSAYLRGDLKEMWNFTEASEEPAQSDDGAKKEPSANQSMFSDEKSLRNEAKLRKAMSKHIQHGESESEGETSSPDKKDKSTAKVKKLESEFRRDRKNDLVYFAITRHAPLRRSGAGMEKEDTQQSVSNQKGGAERPSKRMRTA